MAQLVLHIGGLPTSGAGDGLARFKADPVRSDVDCGWCRLTVLQPSRERERRFHRDGHRWLTWIGTWFHKDAPTRSPAALLASFDRKDVIAVAKELEGFFVVLLGDDQSQAVHVITDRCGSCHMFRATSSGGVFLSSSSAVLGALVSAPLDRVGVRDLLALGSVYGTQTLWESVSKLRPATVSTFGRITREVAYWSFSMVQPERLDLSDAAATIGNALVSSMSTIGKAFPRVACDVTAGYDSRACLAALIAGGIRPDTTVSGPEDSADVQVSKYIAEQLGLTHLHIGSVAPSRSLEDVLNAVRLTDAEYEAFEYVNVRSTHLQLAENHDVSVNGSFGELARGYWWELLLPTPGRRSRLQVSRIVSARFVAAAHDTSRVLRSLASDLKSRFDHLAAEAIDGIAHFPNTSQLDCLYYTLRMQRWQGRIASSTDQIWPCLSPFQFSRVLMPVLETKWRARIGSRVIRKMVKELAPVLAAIPLEHGYPCEPVSPRNAYRFVPYFAHLGRKVRTKLGRKWSTSPTSGMPVREYKPFAPADAETIRSFAAKPLLLDTGLFHETALRTSLTNAATGPPTVLDSRLMSLELLLRCLRDP